MGFIRPFSIFLLKYIYFPNNTINNVPLSSIMAVEAVTFVTFFVVDNSSSNAITEHTCSVYDTIRKFLPKQWVKD